MKIGYLCSDFDIPLYGAEGCSLHVRDVADALVAQGQDVFIVCPELGSGPAPTNARVYDLQPSGADAAEWRALAEEPAVLAGNLERDLRLIAYNHWLKGAGSAIVERERPDVLYERYSLFGSAGLELSRRYGVPLILELNTDLRLEQDGYDKFVLGQTAEAVESELFRGAAAIVAVSGWLGEWAVSRGADRDRVHVIPNAVDERLFAQRVSGEEVRAKYGLDGSPVVGFVGSFQPWHDVNGLLDAAVHLREDRPTLRLLIVGGGDGRRDAEAAAERRGLADAALFTGRVPHDETPPLLAAMDVAVAPYSGGLELGFLPLKLFEYMAAGRPTVAAAVGEIGRLIEDGETGLLYPPGDGRQLADCIDTLLADRDLARRLGDAARAKVLRDHTWRAVAERIKTLAESLLG
ncbi:MAG TPA: glycosyltransferase family 4 protein [Gaiellaceae bacterium]|nr:glycosyltransferase family 4 protein [Gaiellaceae bacterium]